FFVAQREGMETLAQEAWENIFGAFLHRKHWRLRRDDLRILVLRVNHNSLLGILKKTTPRPAFPQKLSFLILRLLRWEEGRQREELRWFQLFDRSPDLLFLVTQEGKILESNTKVNEVLGWSKKLLQGENIELLLGKGTWKALLEKATSILPPTVEIEIGNACGELRPFEVHLSLFDTSTEGFYLLSLRDIGERKRYEFTLLKLALYDQLTGLYNRRFLEEYLSKELERCKREKYPLSIAFVDVDSFKTINDFYGHVFGDEVLKAVASTMQKMVRASDIVARYGGDEFVIVLPRASEESALQVMRRIAKNLRGCQISDEPFPVRISYGVYTWNGKENLAAIFQEIDRRMYRMKKEGDSS
ncbi:MAG: diguanylate cyclase, partial [Candidatus Caldatribacteriaceae bacterium]